MAYNKIVVERNSFGDIYATCDCDEAGCPRRVEFIDDLSPENLAEMEADYGRPLREGDVIVRVWDSSNPIAELFGPSEVHYVAAPEWEKGRPETMAEIRPIVDRGLRALGVMV